MSTTAVVGTMLELTEEEKAQKKAFAEEQRRQLVEDLGFAEEDAEKILSAAGPGRAVAAAKWAIDVVDGDQAGRDAFLIILGGLLSPRNKTGWQRLTNALRFINYEVPEVGQGNRRGFKRLMKGARTAVLSPSFPNVAPSSAG